ncbi:uncharacterized protein CTRU02_204719 [Colletotrichum truncatum]|uniref:Uncharacterized protein n=1 Tax=Colletotrichum truncatum TaxID=5467 RepID=A0ACC3ZCY0_COLTU|nr:uncharacterized protein CTRU02_02952 [Colletotrichum truncatum]KAF6797910.1 hypothetical protein CTRU02_02952 [Colletotrichum truncatum]
MKPSSYFIAILAAAAPVAAQVPPPELTTRFATSPISFSTPVQTGCPTVTDTLEVCATCAVLQCIVISTLVQVCGCPTPVSTAWVDFPCDGTCGQIGCSTSYTVIPGEVPCTGVPSSSRVPPGSSTIEKTTASVTVSTIVTQTATVATTESVPDDESSTDSPSESPTGSSTGSSAGAGTVTTSAAAPTATPNAAGRLAVPFKFW